MLFALVGSISLKDAVGDSLPQTSWQEHGFTEDQRASIQTAFQRGVDEKFIPGGSLMLIHRGEVILKDGFGFADLKTKEPFTTEAPCRIASLTKPHTTTMIALLVEQGKLSFDDPVDKYIPGFGNLKVQGREGQSRAPTVGECLSHTTGFPGNADLKDNTFQLDFNSDLEAVTLDLAAKELLHEPGTHFAYSRLGYMIAGRVAEVIMNKPFPQIMEEVLFRRIGAVESTFDYERMKDRIPTPYERTRNGFPERVGEGLGTVINPGGSQIATPDGVARLLLLHRNKGMVDGKRIIAEAVLQQMYVPQPGTGKGGYGYGFNILKKRPDGTTSRIQHTGGSGTIGIIDFDLDLIIIILTQVPQAQTNQWRQPLLQSIYSVFE